MLNYVARYTGSTWQGLNTGQNGANGTVRINGVKPKVQKVTFLQQKGDYQRVKIHWVVAATKFSGNYAMDYVNADDKPTMHVEIMRTQQSQIRISGDYDCQPQ